jgi:outer membrane protein insertion porin family
LKLTFVKGDAARVRMVRIVGNKGTQEHVIRRDVTVLEDKPYDHKAVKETQLRVMRTGFFQAVVARAIPTERPDIVDVEVAVTEQPTWLANLAPAFLGSEGLILIGIAADRNLFGTGLAASAVGQFSQLRQLFDLSLTEPRLFDTRIAISGEVHRRDLAYDGFHVKSEVGGGLRAGFPLPVNGLSVGGGLGVEYGGVTPDASLVLEGLAPSLFPRDVFRNVVSVNLTYDARDSVLAPRRGVYTELAMSYAGPATLSGRPGTFDHLGFLSSSANARLFWSPLWDITLKSNTELGFVFNPHGGDVPVTDRFFLGGLGSVRGYIPRSIGPGLAARANVVKRAADGGLVETGEQVDVTIGVGGVVELVQNLELEFPIWPGTPFRGFLFCDAGNAFTEQELAMLGTSATPERGTGLRHWLMWSTGFGLLVETPVAPLRFQFSFPLTRRTTRAVVDNPVDFFFGIGSAF